LSGKLHVPEATPVAACRLCGRPGLKAFLDLGETPIANALLRPTDLAELEPRYPLEVGFCPGCSLVQLTYELPADAIFNEAYPYYSSFSDALCRHAREHALGLIESQGLGPESLVVEVASNDGYLLRNFVELGIPVLGIEPTQGPAAAARAAGVPTKEVFFTTDLADELAADGIRADVIVANNVMAHVPDLNGFVEGFARLLAPDGVITIENPYVRDLVQNVEFDTIYHEHFCYFSCSAVAQLMRRHGLYLNDVEYFPELHGGTLRWWVARHARPTQRLRDYLAAEAELGMTGFDFYAKFGARVASTQSRLVEMLQQLRDDGADVAAYGAAAKGATLLNSSGVDASLVSFVVDRNPHKQGHWMPGARLPILDPSALLERQPDYLLLLAWNFKDEIIQQHADYARRGGRFIVPVPEPEIL
jgi:SAM-dependent methyltransferase